MAFADYKLRFLKHPEVRDVVFVLGAGASKPDGVPLQNEIVPLMLTDGSGAQQESQHVVLVKSFIESNFGYDTQRGVYPSLEEIFGFIDYFIRQGESLSNEFSEEKLSKIREYLILIIHYIITEKVGDDRQTYHRFWELVKELNRNISVVTLNYDTVLDEAFDFLYPDYGFIDYCIPLMNYDHYVRDHARIGEFNWWEDPRKPVPIWKESADPTAIKIIKLHGSTNWKYCNCCNQVLLTPWATKVDLKKALLLKLEAEWEGKARKSSYWVECPIDRNKLRTMIIPPSHVKPLGHPVMGRLFSETAREIRASRKVVFIGYSFPESDVHFKALFKKNLREDHQLYVIDIDGSESFRRRYEALGKVTFKKKSFGDALRDQTLFNEILSPS